ncbi:MAG TPA: Grx4 family monothiol glutaredoxin [Caulobacteraceae bacterium]|jgi:monothiol glutaredoxin|nr:Grx4 family monothiol glutaredoxin [Caulobacteraceae bacterium]
MTDTITTAADDKVQAFIGKTVADNPVVLFMKGVPDQPACGFSAVTVQILDHLGVDFAAVNVLESDEVRQGIKTFSDWPTVPQLYVKGEFVGGCDIIREMFSNGELKAMFEDKGLIGA